MRTEAIEAAADCLGDVFEDCFAEERAHEALTAALPHLLEPIAEELERRAEGYAKESGIPSAYRDCANYLREQLGGDAHDAGTDSRGIDAPSADVTRGAVGDDRAPEWPPLTLGRLQRMGDVEYFDVPEGDEDEYETRRYIPATFEEETDR